MGNGMNKVLPDLYLGNFKDSRDREQLSKHNITHILSIHDSAAPMLQMSVSLNQNYMKNKEHSGTLATVSPHLPWTSTSVEEMTYLCIPAADSPSQNLIQYFKESIKFIHECRLQGEGCLVHCLAGVSRSVTLVVAYIMTVTNLGWQDALKAVRAARACAGPNAGFLRQLEEFEKTELHNVRKWLKEEFKENSFKDEDEVQILLSKSCKPNGVEVDVCDIINT